MDADETFEITPAVLSLANRPYNMVIEHNDRDGWVGRYAELPGHLAVGDTLDEMYALAEDAKRAWIATALAEGMSVPEPMRIMDAPRKSGKFVVRVAPAIHTALAVEARRQGVSLNELVSDALAIVATRGFERVVRDASEGRSENT